MGVLVFCSILRLRSDPVVALGAYATTHGCDLPHVHAMNESNMQNEVALKVRWLSCHILDRRHVLGADTRLTSAGRV